MNKKNKIIVILLVGIIIILTILCILFASNTISFNNKQEKVENNKEIVNESMKDDSEINNDTKENNSSIRYYRNSYEVTEKEYTIVEFELKSDKTLNYIIGSLNNNTSNENANIVVEYSGTYTENDKNITLNIKSKDDNCEAGKYACEENIILQKSPTGDLINEAEQNQLYFLVSNPYLIK